MNATAQWFKAAEHLGECTDILFAKKGPNEAEPEWISVSHCDYDGIGGFANLLREAGAEIDSLPQTHFPNKKIVSPLLSHFKKSQPTKPVGGRENWDLTLAQEKLVKQGNPPARAWHLFSEEQTQQIRHSCRARKVSVNSQLLQALDQSVRPDTKRPELGIPWLIPVNLRGDITYPKDTANHVSCVEPVLFENDCSSSIQRQIAERLASGEHRRNHLTLALTTFLPQKIKTILLRRSRKAAAGNIGSFSNLGVWDSEKSIDTSDSWLFCPPVCTGHLLAAGCVTFQNRLAIALQAHPSVDSANKLSDKWITIWRDSIVHGI